MMEQYRNPQSESNSDKFRVLANKRVPKALKALDLIGNLSNRSNYTYSDEDVKKIVKTLKEKIADIEDLFAKKRIKTDQWKL